MKHMIGCLLGALTLNLSGYATSVDIPINNKPWEKPAENLKVIDLFELSEEMLNEIIQGKHPDIAVQFREGSQLPISFFLKGDLVNLIGDQANLGGIEIQQTLYARCMEGDLIISTDLNDWKPFLEFITGNVSVVLSVQNHEPTLTFGAQVNRRT